MTSRNATGAFSEESELLDSTTRFESGTSRRTRSCRNPKKRQESIDLVYEPYGLPSSSGSHDPPSVFQDPSRIDGSPRTEYTIPREPFSITVHKNVIDKLVFGSLAHINGSLNPSRSTKRRTVKTEEEVPVIATGINPPRIILPPPQRNSPIRNSPLRISPARVSSVCNSPARSSQSSSDQASMDGHITGGVTLPPLYLPEHSTHGGITLPPLRSVLDVENYAESILNSQETDLENTDEDLVVVDLTSSPSYPSPSSIIDLTSSPVIDLTAPYTPYLSFPHRFALEPRVSPEIIVIDDDSSDATPSRAQRVTQNGNMTPPYSQNRLTAPPPRPSQSMTFAQQLSSLVNNASVPRGLQLKCAICLDRPKEVSSTICGHIFCFECISTAVRTQKMCSLCRRPITKKHIKRLEFKVL
ncbi:4174_t:CDS:2 [Acaulospora colombiana]|uniref:4174_t:CDS:1 n=1 Tax=Acaulospora colombiana TaxID=27376 RepID=A0ACA9KWF3_9GLOM|nr:4174_t:CDS:2 [Acaulospora colombiana]